MSQDVKAACAVDLSFPFHGAASAEQRLAELQRYMAKETWDAAYYAGGNAAAFLEQSLAERFGMEAALWFPTGTMAQGVAARIYAGERGHGRVLLHPTSHLVLHEEDGYRHAHHLEADLIGDWRGVITAEHLRADAACVFVELPQRHSGGLLPDWATWTTLKQRAADLSLPLHVDGARIWSCRPFYGDRSYADIVAGVRSLYVSFYKDIGALGGAALIGDADFIAQAKLWRARLGGLLIEPWPIICDTLRLLDHRIAQMPAFVAKARALAASLAALPGQRVDPNPPHVNMFHVLLPCSAAQGAQARDQAARETGIWLASRFWDYEGPDQCAMEIHVGEKAAALDETAFAEAVQVLVGAVKR